jgi:hypothetical protein
MKVLRSAAIIQCTDREEAVKRYQALFDAPPLLEFPIPNWNVHVAVFPGISVVTGEPSALSPLATLRATVFVDSFSEIKTVLLRTGWTMEGSFGAGASVLARDPEGNLLEFVETPVTD